MASPAVTNSPLRVAKRVAMRSLSTMPTQHLDINERFKDKRLEHSMTQSEWAKTLGTSASTIKKIELGHTTPNHYLIRQLCRKFVVDANWLYGLCQ